MTRANDERLFGIYAIVDQAAGAAPLQLLEAILAGGVRVVQYRAKAGIDRELVRRMHARTAAAGALLIVNDDLEAALDADGWHAGQEDLAAHDRARVRERLGERLFGVSCGTPAESRRALAAGADYIGAGPFFATATKIDAGAAIGVDGTRAVVRSVSLPVVAIGGIALHNLGEVAASGARMAAVISAIAAASDPRAATQALVAAWQAQTQPPAQTQTQARTQTQPQTATPTPTPT